MASIATFALKAGEWFRLVLLVIFLLLVVSGTSCPTGAGNPLIPTVQFSGATSEDLVVGEDAPGVVRQLQQQFVFGSRERDLVAIDCYAAVIEIEFESLQPIGLSYLGLVGKNPAAK
jgi:hypothetical protein